MKEYSMEVFDHPITHKRGDIIQFSSAAFKVSRVEDNRIYFRAYYGPWWRRLGYWAWNLISFKWRLIYYNL
jgi:hypothetical protein